VVVTITPELKQALAQAGDEPVRLEDPETREAYVLLKRDVYERLLKLGEVERVASSLSAFDEFHPRDAYPTIDRAFAEGWDDPKMAAYDEYEKHRP
jgi:hypothetical protein